MVYDSAMTLDPQTAATELESLRQQVAAQLQTIAAHEAGLSARDRELDFKQRRIDALTAEIARLKRVQFGAKTEALSALQKSLFGEAVDEDVAVAAQQLQDTQSPSERLRARPKREALPEHLPRVTTVHEPERCTCETCAAALVKLGEHVSEKLAYTPARFHVERHVYPQYACRACETVVAVPVLPAIIDRGVPAASLLAQVVIAKYCDHLPLYRQQAIYARAGVELARSTLADWSGAVGRLDQQMVVVAH